MRPQCADQVVRCTQLVVGASERPAQLEEFPRRQQRQVIAHDRAGVCNDGGQFRGRARHRAQLQVQAFADVARADAGGIEALQQSQRCLQFVRLDFGLRRADGEQVLQALVQVAVVVKRVDQQFDQRTVARRRLGARHLREQVILQRGGGACPLARVVVVFAPAFAASAPVERRVASRLECGVRGFASGRRLAPFAVAVAVGAGTWRRSFVACDGAIRLHPDGKGERVVVPLEQRVVRERLLDLLVSSTVDNLERRRIDCCNWGVSARCCDSRSERAGFMPLASAGRKTGREEHHRPAPCEQ